MIPALSALAQLGCLVVACVEVWLYRSLSRAYVTWPAFAADGSELPSMTGRTALRGMAGETASLVYRWDEEAKALLFRRKFRVVPGHWGLVAGALRQGAHGEPQLTWHPFPLVLGPIFVGLGLFGMVVFVVVEGQAAALAIGPAVLLAALVLFAFQWQNGRALLRDRALRELAEAIEAR